MKKRKRYTAQQKATIVLDVLKEEKSVAQIASEYGVHPNQLYRWKREGQEHLHEVFEDRHKEDRERAAAHEQEKEKLYAEIGRLTTEVNWLKKIWH